VSEVTASLVVQFRNEAAGVLQAEIDARPAGYNKGRTSFVPGDSPAFLVYKSFNVTIDSVEVSAGNLATLAPVLVDVEEIITFAKADEATLQKPYFSGMTGKWLGNNLGSLTLVGDTKIRIADPGVGVLKLSYKTRALAYRMAGLPTTLNGEAEYQVLAVISGEAV
jgi:hypothetical protein